MTNTDHLLTQAQRQAQELRWAEAKAGEWRRIFVETLKESRRHGLSLRQLAKGTGYSFARIRQLTTTPEEKKVYPRAHG